MTATAAILTSLVAGLEAQAVPARALGLEVDVLPWVSGGYYGSLWYGTGHVRIRAVVTETTLPSFLVEDGFEDADLAVLAAIVDYLPRPGFTGPWFGAGLEYWDRSVTNVGGTVTAEWENWVVTAGAGYIWQVVGPLYVNPWAALHVVVGGDVEIPVGAAVFDAGRVVPEVSVKVGWRF